MSSLIQLIKVRSDNLVNTIVLLMVIALAYSSAQITLKLIDPLPLAATTTAKKQQSVSGHNLLPDLNRLLAQHLFGELNEQQVVVEPEPTMDAPETKLSLVLQGVSMAAEDSKSSAIISETANGEGELYWVGDSILGKAILTAVYEDRVVIKQGGRVETLRFSEDFRSSGGLTRNFDESVSSVGPVDSSDVLRSYRARREDKDAMIREMGSALNEINKGNFDNFDNLLDEYGSNMQRNIEEAARSAGLEDAEGGGMKVGNRASETWTNRVGLQQGDVIKTVNQYPVQVLKSDRSAIDDVIKSCVARIEVMRGANTFVVTYPFCN